MKAEVVRAGDDRVIVSKIRPEGDRSICLEIHRGEKGGFACFFVLLTEEEARELSKGILEVASPKKE